jgi:phage FluMu gp28-like protein
MFIGVDVGRRRDLTVIWVFAKDADRLVTVGLFELAGAPFRAQFELLGELLSIRRVRKCCIDAGGIGMQLAEQCVEEYGAHRVEGVTFTPALKSQLGLGLRIAVENRRIVIPNDERIAADWHSLQRTMSETGHFRLTAPRREGSHADRFWSAALALHAADEPAGKVEAVETPQLLFAKKGTW